MKITTNYRRATGVLAGAAAVGLLVSGCSSDPESSASGSAAAEPVTLTFLIDDTETTRQVTKALSDAYTAKHPNVTFEYESRPGGGDGDNIVKTRLATGEMTDLFFYNSGSLFQALNPTETLLPLTDEPWADAISPTYQAGVSAGGDLYGVPAGTAMGGGVLYNIPIYESLGLDIPKTWDEFMSNNAAILAAGEAAPVIQTFADTWTSQLFVLGDNYNVLADNPNFADDYTANKAHYADTPAALASFGHQQEVFEAGYLNVDYASATFADGVRMVATGEGAHYPMLTFAITNLVTDYPENLNDVGFFALPGEDADNAGLTTWLANGIYVPNTTSNPDVVKDFLGFVSTVEGCDLQTEAVGAQGPYFIDGCTLPADVPRAVADMLPYFEAGLTAPALEFLSPIKGPLLEQITVEVGSGIRDAASGAALYDEDVKKQALQLGLEGWE